MAKPTSGPKISGRPISDKSGWAPWRNNTEIPLPMLALILATDGCFVMRIYRFMLVTGWRLLGRMAPENLL